MAETSTTQPLLETTAGPHVFQVGLTTRGMMFDVLLGLAGPVASAVYYFRSAAVTQLLICISCAWLTEALGCWLRQRRLTLGDGSATITAVILALSLPPLLPWYAAAMGSVVAVGLGKLAFGGLGNNLFNPAMVGRAFLMLSLPIEMTTWAEPVTVHATTQATPLAAAKFAGESTQLASLFVGRIAGSLGETSTLAILIGGGWLLLRRAADWRLTLGMVLGVLLGASVQSLTADPAHSLGVLGHLCAGSVMFGAFFIVTDPVTSPLTARGRWVYGGLVGLLTMTIRWFGGYPEGVMFSVLLANAVGPLIDRATATTPVGGKVRIAHE